MNKDFYTKLIYEHKYPDDYGPTRIEQNITVWDTNMNQLLEMFHTLIIGATYQQEIFEQALAEYLEERNWIVYKEENEKE